MEEPDRRDSCHRQVHLTMENPDHSLLAWLISIIILGTILASTGIFVLESYPVYSDWERLEYYEFVCVVIFSLEYVTRFLFHMGSSRIEFVFTPFNMIDLLAILPWYMEILLATDHLAALRVLRILRLFRLLRHSNDLKMFITCISRSLDSFKLLALFLGFAVLIFSSLMWYAERGTYDPSSVRQPAGTHPRTCLPPTCAAPAARAEFAPPPPPQDAALTMACLLWRPACSYRGCGFDRTGLSRPSNPSPARSGGPSSR